MAAFAPKEPVTLERQNPHLAATLSTHLIGDTEAYGIDADNYERFIARRAATIAMALNVKLMSMTPDQAAMTESALVTEDAFD
jgi:hypothetical protein